MWITKLLPITPIVLLLACGSAVAEVVSETLYFLQPDGKHYLLQRSIRSDSSTHRFHLPKGVDRDALRYVSPADYRWEKHDSGGDAIAFDSGSFTLIYASRFSDQELQQQSDGSWRFRSWQGQPDSVGRYGYWYSPGNFDRYGFGWLLPENIEIVEYRSNVEGHWARFPHALGFYAENVNNVTFEIRYRIHQPSAPKPSTELRPKTTPQTAPAPDDQDGVAVARDLCPHTPAGAKVDKVGCALDADRDGVPDGIDRCPATEEETPVDTLGCPLSRERDTR